MCIYLCLIFYCNFSGVFFILWCFYNKFYLPCLVLLHQFQWRFVSHQLEHCWLSCCSLFLLLRDYSAAMQPADSDGDNGTNASFWEPHQYSRTVKRAENANKLCSELALMVQERADIEKAYAANLRKFAARLELFARTGLEYGTGTNILFGLAKEAEDNAELHSVGFLKSSLLFS